MIQDMLEPEYIGTGKGNVSLIECTPVAIVPVPGATDWFQKENDMLLKGGIGRMDEYAPSKGNDMDTARGPKRLKRDAMDTTATTAGSTSTLSSSSSDNVDAGVGIDAECGVLATFYIDQYPETTPGLLSGASLLKLNQIVEFMGVLDDFPGAKDMGGDDEGDDDDDVEMETGVRRNRANEGQPIGMDSNAMWDDDDKGNLPVVPKHFLRLHIVWFRVVSLDESPIFSLTNPPSSIDLAHCSLTAISCLTEALNGSIGNDMSSPSHSINNTELVAQALWMLLNSQAERNGSDQSVVVTPMETILGCASLRINLALALNGGVAPTACGNATMDRFIAVLRRLVPVVKVISITTDALATDYLAAPSRVTPGRLSQTALQLPAGSVLVLDIRHLPPSNRLSPQYLSSRQWTNWQTIRDLCRHHRIQYSFEGGMRIPFDADYRIIVVSNDDVAIANTMSPLSCALNVQWQHAMDSLEAVGDFGKPQSVTDQTLSNLREYLRQCRQSLPIEPTTINTGSIAAPKNVKLAPVVLERAQSDFLQRRAAHREAVGEVDFHRWLTLTRLHARSRMSKTAVISDWTAALALDDAMRATMQTSAP